MLIQLFRHIAPDGFAIIRRSHASGEIQRNMINPVPKRGGRSIMRVGTKWPKFVVLNAPVRSSHHHE